ncbi:MAG: hypothetical protein ACYC5M_04665 [Anaerolineae bacterium]
MASHWSSLIAAQNDTVEKALWAAMQTLAEKAAMLRGMAERAEAQGSRHSAESFERQARVEESRAQAIQDLLLAARRDEHADVDASSAMGIETRQVPSGATS